MEEEAKGRKNRLDSSAADSLPPPSFLGLLCRVSAHPWASKLLPPSLTPFLSLSLSLSLFRLPSMLPAPIAKRLLLPRV